MYGVGEACRDGDVDIEIIFLENTYIKNKKSFTLYEVLLRLR